MKKIFCVVGLLCAAGASRAQTPPVFVSQPANVSVADGGSVTLSAAVNTSLSSDGGIFSPFAAVTWELQLPTRTLAASSVASSQINARITASMSFGPVTTADSGTMRLIARNAFGTTASEVRMLTVTPVGPSISAQPVSQSILVGGGATFSVSVRGTAPISYQWRKNGSPISGATTATLAISGAQLADAGGYSVVVSNSLGSLTSAVANLTVTSVLPPSITRQPSGARVVIGARVAFSVEAGGSAPLEFQWRKNGSAILGATASTFVLATAQLADAGTFSVTVSNTAGSVASEPAVLSVDPPPNPGRIVNLSVRTNLPAGQPLIVGTVVSGGRRDILMRAAGPSLTALGVAGAMPDPVLELYQGSTLVAANDNWAGTLAPTFAAVGAFAFQANGSRDAALVQSVDGARSILVRGTTGGVVLVEAYDTGTSSSPRLVNVSARNRVGTGEDILIAGFVIGGSSAVRVLVRAVGPTLGAFGVTGALSDPILEVFRNNSVLIGNDNWGGAAELQATFASVGAFRLPFASRDAAAVTTLQPGSYTVQVRGVGSETGEALVEIYEVP